MGSRCPAVRGQCLLVCWETWGEKGTNRNQCFSALPSLLLFTLLLLPPDPHWPEHCGWPCHQAEYACGPLPDIASGRYDTYSLAESLLSKLLETCTMSSEDRRWFHSRSSLLATSSMGMLRLMSIKEQEVHEVVAFMVSDRVDTNKATSLWEGTIDLLREDDTVTVLLHK